MLCANSNAHSALFRLYKPNKKKNYIIVTNFIFLINFVNVGMTMRTLIQVFDHQILFIHKINIFRTSFMKSACSPHDKAQWAGGGVVYVLTFVGVDPESWKERKRIVSVTIQRYFSVLFCYFK
jgi:hypothetical protein